MTEMTDSTVYAERLVAAVARAFYGDAVVVVVDLLIREKYLRDDEMAQTLNLPARTLRKALYFLQEEHLVKFEMVRVQRKRARRATKFWYIDYNQAVHSIRLRLVLLQRQLKEAEQRARASNFFVCPGYAHKRCNGHYTAEEAQVLVDMDSGSFLCLECFMKYDEDPEAPPREEYTLELVDNSKDIQLAMENTRRFMVQMSEKSIGSTQLRPGIFTLLKKAIGTGRPITSNLPSENLAVARPDNEDDLPIVTNAMGYRISYSVVRDGGAHAFELASGCRRRNSIMNAAASRVSTSFALDVKVREQAKRKLEGQPDRNNVQKRKRGIEPSSIYNTTSTATTNLPFFLINNVGRHTLDNQLNLLREQDMMEDHYELEGVAQASSPAPRVIVLQDADNDEMPSLCEESYPTATFLSLYAKEMGRQQKLIAGKTLGMTASSSQWCFMADDDANVAWEDA